MGSLWGVCHADALFSARFAQKNDQSSAEMDTFFRRDGRFGLRYLRFPRRFLPKSIVCVLFGISRVIRKSFIFIDKRFAADMPQKWHSSCNADGTYLKSRPYPDRDCESLRRALQDSLFTCSDYVYPNKFRDPAARAILWNRGDFFPRLPFSMTHRFFWRSA
jgi:hypothetical protein